MSYDLFFTEPKITQQQFEAYFGSRKHFKINNNQALYDNDETGVYFSFEYSDETSQDTDAPEATLSFNINFFRPRFFAFEAEPEVHEVVRYFGFRILDPSDKMVDGKYSTEGFFGGWNIGNEYGVRTFINDNKASSMSVYFRAKEELQSFWRWNYMIQDVQKSRNDVFIPRIIYLNFDGDIHSVIVWGDALPILIPRVDYIVIFRENLAPRKLLKKQKDMCILPFDKILPLIESFASREYGIPSFDLCYSSAPSSISSFVKTLERYSGKIERIGFDHVLDQDLIGESKKRN